MIEIFNYDPLWETMKRNNVTQYQLLKGGIDNRTLDSLKKNKNITMITLEKLCRIVGCTPNDIVSFQYRLVRASSDLTSLLLSPAQSAK